MRSASIRNVQRVDSFLSVAGSSWSGTEFYDAQEEVRTYVHTQEVCVHCQLHKGFIHNFKINRAGQLKGFGASFLPSFFLQ